MRAEFYTFILKANACVMIGRLLARSLGWSQSSNGRMRLKGQRKRLKSKLEESHSLCGGPVGKLMIAGKTPPQASNVNDSSSDWLRLCGPDHSGALLGCAPPPPLGWVLFLFPCRPVIERLSYVSGLKPTPDPPGRAVSQKGLGSHLDLQTERNR